jgi:glutamate/tyrosine decarboxylase-like PLP-dependent enzyme
VTVSTRIAAGSIRESVQMPVESVRSPATPPALQRAIHHASEWLGGLDTRPVGARADLESLRARLNLPLPERGMDPAQIIDELVVQTDGGHHGSASGRFYAWVIGGSLDAALAADWMTSAWDGNAGLYAVAPAAAVVEEVAGAWIKELLDLPREASFAFTTGCQMAHFTCLAAARHAVLARHGWDLAGDGMSGSPAIRIFMSDQRHSTIDRAARYLGFGTRNLEVLPTDDAGRLAPETLSAALAAWSGPSIVVLNAADLNIAAFDSFEELIPIARAANAWVHVDGAFGLVARASRAKHGLMKGVETADSWATDGHKWLNVPFDCGIAIVRDREAHRAAMTISASYLVQEDRARDELDWTPEFSRRGRGYTVYAAIRELGREGLEALVDRCCAHCRGIVTGIGALEGAEALWVSELNQGLVRFRDARPGASEEDHDRYTDRVIAGINATGEAFFSGTTWRGRRAMRVSVVNWRTNGKDVERAIAAARGVLEKR